MKRYIIRSILLNMFLWKSSKIIFVFDFKWISSGQKVVWLENLSPGGSLENNQQRHQSTDVRTFIYRKNYIVSYQAKLSETDTFSGFGSKIWPSKNMFSTRFGHRGNICDGSGRTLNCVCSALSIFRHTIFVNMITHKRDIASNSRF